jgi:hydrogenase/urease accessory protein HupE
VPVAVTLRCLVVLLLVPLAMPALGHRLTPAYLGLTETAEGTFDVQWKVSIPGGLAALLVPRLPAECELTGPVRTRETSDVRHQSGELACPGGLGGERVGVEGLPSTHTDVLLRVDYADGSSYSQRLTPGAPEVVIPREPSYRQVVGTYLVLGIEHILLGIDHLLFVLALLLLVSGVWRLVATITAFTVAHSITLGAATLGFVNVPSAPVEAVIALSILFLAVELARRHQAPAAPKNLALRFPWLVAFSFGLLHGFGFAGELANFGLPAGAIPLALLFFNVGVEVGQLLFVAVVLGLGWAVRRARAPLPRWWPPAVAYGIGGLAVFWMLERTLEVL